MYNKLLPSASLFSVAIVIWSVCALLSSHLAESLQLEHEHRGTLTGETPAQIKELEAKVAAEPGKVQPKLEIARILSGQSEKDPSAESLMKAVQAYSDVLTVEPENPEALLGIANISFRSGVLDKALDYYQRYLKKNPNNLGVRIDYSLLLLQTGSVNQAVSSLQEITAGSPNLFQGWLSLALAQKFAGSVEQAREAANRARRLAPNDAAKNVVDDFLKNVDRPVNDTSQMHEASGEVKAISPERLSPAALVQSYFENHPIVGPKLVRILWPEVTKVQVEIKEFPVDQMPPFAKAKFIENIKKALSNLPEPVKVEIVDVASKAVLLSVDVG